MGHCLFLRKGEVHTAPVTGVLASSLAVGSTVKLMEGGTAVEYLVVNQGIPSNSSLYDTSCDGTWLLRKDCHSSRRWHTLNANDYANSVINTWLNGEFYSSFGESEQSVIKQIKIPYRAGRGYGGTDQSGENGLSCKSFLLSGYEVGWDISTTSGMPLDGAKLLYFEAGTGTSANNQRIGKLNGSAIMWWLRSPYGGNQTDAILPRTSGSYYETTVSNFYGIRPALILPGNALFDKTTMLLKGVK